MEWDFRYLQGKYTDAGARAKFEEICHALLREEYPELPHKIRVSQGDGGIDIVIGDFGKPVHVFQCKYFSGILGDSQKDQIRRSFRAAKNNPAFTMNKWTLLLSIDLSLTESSWWSGWKQSQEDSALTIDYLGQAELLAGLRAHGLYDVYFNDSNDQRLIQQLSDSVLQLQERLSEMDLNWREASASRFITGETVSAAAAACTQRDVLDYYRVSNRYSTMLRVICAQKDVPHCGAEELLHELLERPAPIIITGNGGWGKSSLMLRTAVRWALRGQMAVWLRLTAGETLTDAQAEAFFCALTKNVPEGVSLLLCIDNPFEGRASFQALQRAWPTDSPIRLIMAERVNRLSILSDQSEDSMQGWFDGSEVLQLGGESKDGSQLEELGYTCHTLPEEPERQRRILETAVRSFSSRAGVQEGLREGISEKDINTLLDEVLKTRSRRSASLAELIYRALFALAERSKDHVSKTSDVLLDWDEWDRFLKESLGGGRKDSFGLIAAYMLFDAPLRLPLFCRYCQLDQSVLEQALERRRMGEQTEPVVYNPEDSTLRPKHDVIAELYFLFHTRTDPINSLMRRVLEVLNDEETDVLLDRIVDKKEFLQGSAYKLGIDYRAYLEQIWKRVDAGLLRLTIGGRANLCLGRLWLEQKAWKDRPPKEEATEALRRWLEKNAPPPMEGLTGRDRHGMRRFYMEWAIWERSLGCLEMAMQQIRGVLKIDPKNVYVRTELGRLLALNPARREEAEAVFREALEINPNNVPTYIELGRLLALNPARREEAEAVFREALEIDPNNVPTYTELDYLLDQDLSRWDEDEEFFEEALEVNLNNVPTYIELGRLLAQDSARREEAEAVFREALEIDPKNVHVRTELGRLLSADPRCWSDAETVLREALKLAPEDTRIQSLLGRLLAKQPHRRKEAEALLKGVIAQNHRNIQARDILAKLYEKQRRYSEASALYREILNINPNDSYAEAGLMRLQRQLPPLPTP